MQASKCWDDEAQERIFNEFTTKRLHSILSVRGIM
jgi:hypothetical protein